jgi:hypothetical protein
MVVLALALAPSAAGGALADEPAPAVESVLVAHLAYERGTGAEICPDAEAVQRGISAKLGYNPFQGTGGIGIQAKVEHSTSGWLARVQRVDVAAGGGAQELHSDARDCQEIAEALEFAISLILDALKPPPTRQPVPPPVPTELVAPEEAEHVHSGPSALAGLGVVGSIGTAPEPALGIDFVAELRWPEFSIGLEGRLDFPATGQTSLGEVQTTLVLGALAPCLRLGSFGVCALAEVGQQKASVDAGPTTDSLFAALGARGFWDLTMVPHLVARIQADVLASLNRSVPTVNGQTAWDPPPVMAGLGLVLGVPFL